MPAHGDAGLAAELSLLADRRARSLAAAVIDTSVRPSTRMAFIDADASTRFEIGSITKALTGMLIAVAIERRELTLDTAVGDVLPACPSAELRSVTMQELCTHTSGLGRVGGGPELFARGFLYALFGLDPYRHATFTAAPGVVDRAARQSLRHRGHRRYSNLGAAVAGELLATAARSSYPDLLRERVFAPVGMCSSAVASQGDTAARGWSARGRRMQPWVMRDYAPAGGVLSTLSDMAALATSLLDGSGPGQSSLIPIAGVETDRPGRRSGMFWVIDTATDSERTMVWHNGQTGGYSAFLALYPEAHRAVVVLSNVARASDSQQIALGLTRRSARSDITPG